MGFIRHRVFIGGFIRQSLMGGFNRGNLHNLRNLRIEKQGEFRYNPNNWFRVQHRR
jgi:hypothetical protein